MHMHDDAAGWSRLLTDRLDGELAAAAARNLPIDPALFGSVHALFGAEMMLRVADINRADVARYLHHLADALGHDDKMIPLMVTLDQAVR